MQKQIVVVPLADRSANEKQMDTPHIKDSTPPKVPDPVPNPTTDNLTKDLVTPARVTQNSSQKSLLPKPATSRVEENILTMTQIEGHSISEEDRRGRDHILYNLPNLNSLPKRSSTSMSYLSASQRKSNRKKDGSLDVDKVEIQLRLKVAEERIASVPIQIFNWVQVLQRGASRQGATPSTTRSL